MGRRLPSNEISLHKMTFDYIHFPQMATNFCPNILLHFWVGTARLLFGCLKNKKPRREALIYPFKIPCQAKIFC